MGNGAMIRLSLKEHLVLVRSLVSLLELGLSLPRALAAAASGEHASQPARAASRISRQMSGGQSLSGAIRRSVHRPDMMVLAMAEASDQTGAAALLLAHAGRYLESRLRFRQSATTAAIYPLFVIGLTTVGAVLLRTALLPRITDVFLAGIISPDAAARYAASGATFFTASGAMGLVATALPGLAVALRAVTPEDSWFRAALDRVRLRLPVLGRLSSAWSLCAIAQASGAMTRCGHPLVRALEKAAVCSGNRWIQLETERAIARIKQGCPPADALRSVFARHRSITHWLDQMRTGADTGRTLTSIAVSMNEEIEKTFARLQALAEPLLIVLAGGFLLGAVVFLVRPFFQLLEQVMP